MGRYVLRWLMVIGGGIGVAILCAMWVVYTGDNRLTEAIFLLADISLKDWRVLALIGALIVSDLLWRQGAMVIRSRAARKHTSCISRQ
jgi:hypothetical protein